MTPYSLYSLATPNGQKVSILLEELGLKYDSSTINILEGDQFDAKFVSMNPNSKIPVLVDNLLEHTVFESGAILNYLGNKYNRFVGEGSLKKSEVMQWLFFQMASVGPMFGQFGHFYKYAGAKCSDPYPLDRYSGEVNRLLDVINNRLKGRNYICDDYSIADIAIYPWIVCLDKFYNASNFLELHKRLEIKRWLEQIDSRDAVKRGLDICSF